MDFYQEFLVLLDLAIERAGNAKKLGDLIGVHSNLLTRWRAKQRVPSLTSIQPVMDYVGAHVVVAPSVQKEIEPPRDPGVEELRRENEHLRAMFEKVREERDLVRGQLLAYKEMLDDERKKIESSKSSTRGSTRAG